MVTAPVSPRTTTLLLDHPLFDGLEPEQVHPIVDQAELRAFDDGETILAQGTMNDILYLVLDGSVVVSRRHGDGVEGHRLNSLGRGSLLGEMSFFQAITTSAEVKALGAATLLAIRRDTLSAETLGAAYDRVRGNVAEHLMRRQQLISERQVEMAHENRRFEAERREFGVLFSVIVVLVGVYQAVGELVRHRAVNPDSQLFDWIALLAFGAPLLAFAYKTRQPLAVFGLTRRGWRRSLVESLLVAMPLMALAVGMKVALQRVGWHSFEGPFVSMERLYATSILLPGPAGLVLSRIQGFGHHFMQELLMRGIVQGSLHRLYGSRSAAPAILATSAIFATAHMFINLPFAFATFVGGCVFGWLYARHGTLVGVTVLHFVMHATLKLLGFF